MKKFAKMSLVAAVAVAGMTSANAADLTEAIKGVDVSGQFRFRTNEASAGATSTDVEVEATVKVPVTDNVTAIFKVDTTRDTTDAAPQSADDLDIEDYYFQYVNSGLTAKAGQHNLPGKATDGAQGDGVTLSYNTGSFNVGVASFMHQNVNTAASSVHTLFANGSVGPVALDAQYVTATDYASHFNVAASASVGPVAVSLGYAKTDEDANDDDLSTLKASISGSAGIVSAKASYVQTGDNGQGSLHGGSGAGTEFELWQFNSANAEMSGFAIDASVAATDKVSVRLAYAAGEYGTADVSELVGQVSYKVSSNLNTYLRVNELDTAGTKTNLGRIEVKYSF